MLGLDSRSNPKFKFLIERSVLSPLRHMNFSCTKNINYKLLFFGTDNFSIKTIEPLLKYKGISDSVVEKLSVVTPPDQKAGRKHQQLIQAPLSKFAKENDLQTYHAPPRSLKDWEVPKDENGEYDYDLAVVSSFGYFIPDRVLNCFKFGAINVHPSLLPKYRGASPIQFAILHSEEETGVSIQEVHPKIIDGGNILSQVKTKIPANVVRVDLENILGKIGGEVLVETIKDYANLKKNATTQDESEITIAPKIQKSDANINWLTDSAKIIYNKFRAFGDKIPPKTTFRSGKKTVGIQFISLSLPADNEAAELQKFMSANATPGSLYLASKNPKYFITTCADGSLLKVDKVKVDGKNIVGVTDFVNGYSVVSEQFAFT